MARFHGIHSQYYFHYETENGLNYLVVITYVLMLNQLEDYMFLIRLFMLLRILLIITHVIASFCDSSRWYTTMVDMGILDVSYDVWTECHSDQ